LSTLDKILYLLKTKGISEKEFTELLGVNKSTVSEWKSGKIKSYNKKLPKIAKILNVSPEYLLSDSNSELKSNHETTKKNNKPTAIESKNLMDINVNNRIDMYLTEEEKILLDNYRKLNHKGKTRVNSFIYDELELMEQDGDMSRNQKITENY